MKRKREKLVSWLVDRLIENANGGRGATQRQILGTLRDIDKLQARRRRKRS